jgi:MFS family permease
MSFRKTELPMVVGLIAAARAVSLIGDEVALIAWLFRAKGDLGHWGVVAVLVAGMLPLVLLSPVAGLLVDRLHVRRLLLGVTVVQALVAFSLAFASEALFVPLIALLACATCVASPSWQVLIPTLVTDEQLPAAMGLVQSAFATAGMLGPFVGGLLYAEVGFRSVLLIDAASYLALASIPLLVRADRVPVPPVPGDHRDSMWSGVRFITSRPLLRSLVILVTLFILTLGVINVVEIFFVTTNLHAGPRGYGLLGLCFGAGMLVVAAGSQRLSERFPRAERLFVASCVLLTLILFFFALSQTLAEAAVALFLLGGANSLLNVQANVMLVRATNDAQHLRGRIFAAVTGVVSAAQILSLMLGGLLLTLWGPRIIIVVGAAAAAVALTVTVSPVLRASEVRLQVSPTVDAVD